MHSQWTDSKIIIILDIIGFLVIAVFIRGTIFRGTFGIILCLLSLSTRLRVSAFSTHDSACCIPLFSPLISLTHCQGLTSHRLRPMSLVRFLSSITQGGKLQPLYGRITSSHSVKLSTWPAGPGFAANPSLLPCPCFPHLPSTFSISPATTSSASTISFL